VVKECSAPLEAEGREKGKWKREKGKNIGKEREKGKRVGRKKIERK